MFLALLPVLKQLVDICDAVLKFWHGLFGSWGLSIIFLTFTVRLAILPLTFKGVKSMQAMQVLQPEIKKLQERYKGDRQRLNEEMMKFYKENKVNPLGSCLPLALQIPFFISLFQLLRHESLLKGESFLFLPDLSKPLTGHPGILALMIVLYIGTQLAASAVTAVSADRNQQIIMYALPFVFTIFIVNFAAGLIVYWITTNIWTFGQQLVVRKMYPKPALVGAGADDSGGGGGNGGGPARGKPQPVAAAAPAEDGKKAKTKPKGKVKSDQSDKADGGNGGAAKAPPASPRKKKKRSGRRR
jgi:YidC/Oxa1 family membrane protein insertase